MKKLLSTIGILALAVIPSVLPQSQPAAAPVTITNVAIENEALPGSERPWAKVVCTFENAGSWRDNVSFNFYVLVGGPSTQGTEQLLVGGLTFANVPKGRSEAILYLSPNAVLRLGAPRAALVELYLGDEQIQAFNWNDLPDDPLSKFRVVDKMLLNIRETPWIIADSDRMPDMVTY